ncbi:MAG: MFS transporter [Armatimonadetes bacterium]|nr:MFS transporter [Armatimonadota bacterium]
MKYLRWHIAGMLMLVTTISYLDRQSLSVAQVELDRHFHMSNTDYGYITFAFLIAYGIMHPFMGRIIDLLTTRRGMAVAVAWWSLANIAHAFAGSVSSFAFLRALLGIGEAGNFPGAAKAVAEWFPPKERAVATGIFNLGAGLGAAIAPPLIGTLIIAFGWRAAFIATGLIGFVWLFFWLLLYQQPEKNRFLTKEELAYIRSGQAEEKVEDVVQRGIWKEVLSRRELWALIAARTLTDPVWLFFTMWLPKYFKAERGFDIKQIAMFVWIPFFAADVGSIVGGGISAYFIKRGWPVLTARKVALLLSAALMPMVIPAVFVESWKWALLFVSIPPFAHQSWAASVLTLPGDLFPKRMVASAYGISGTLGILAGGVVMILVGKIVDFGSYMPIFIAAGFMHLIAAAIIFALIRQRKVHPIPT